MELQNILVVKLLQNGNLIEDVFQTLLELVLFQYFFYCPYLTSFLVDY